MKHNDDILTIKAILLYILNRVPDNRRSIYFIVKAAFCAQESHLVRWAVPLYEDEIFALPFGPVPSTIYNILKGARGDAHLNDVRLKEVANCIICQEESFYATEEADLSWLSPSAINCLDEAILTISTKTFGDLYDTTHESEEYKRAWNSKGRKIMSLVGIAKSAGADEGVLEYLSEHLEIKSALA